MNYAIKELLKRPVAYQPVIAKAIGSVKLTVLWCQLYYWSDKTSNPEGWVYKTRENIYDETGMTRKEQETARDLGTKLGILQCELKGMPAVVHFKIDEEKMIELIEAYLKKHPEKTFTINPKNAAKVLEKTADRLVVLGIFNFWNEQKIVDHRKMTDKIEGKIKAAIREYSEKEVKEAIQKYATVINGEGYFWTYRWTLADFLQRGLTRFLESPIENFKKKEIEKAKKLKEFYRGMPVVESHGKKYVIDHGEWLEFCGDPKDIEKKLV